MNNRYWQILVLVILAAFVLFIIKRTPQSQPATVTDFQSCQQAGGVITDGEPVTCTTPDGRAFSEQETLEPEVIIDQPQYGGLVTSPLTVSGKARGFWFFEASMPVTLKDDQGNVLAKIPAQANGDWMTEDYVPFEGTLEFAEPQTEFGVLLVEKDNPSGDPQFDAAFAVPVRFK